MAEILTCHSGKSIGVINNINNGWILFSFAWPRYCAYWLSCMAFLDTNELHWAIVDVIFSTCVFPVMMSQSQCLLWKRAIKTGRIWAIQYQSKVWTQFLIFFYTIFLCNCMKVYILSKFNLAQIKKLQSYRSAKWHTAYVVPWKFCNIRNNDVRLNHFISWSILCHDIRFKIRFCKIANF